MNLGNFSVSLAVQDIRRSHEFYAKLGFTEFGGDDSKNWLILRNGSTVIGLFQGMFKRNMLTFNPGWDSDAHTLDDFTDIRDLQAELEAAGIEFQSKAEEGSTGPASFLILDPDGNPILFDQHV